MRPLLSIVIPSNNRAELLDEAVSSILSESAFDGMCEICISDNSSGDATEKLVASKYANCGRVVYRRSLDAPLLDENVNKVISIANGAYVWIFGDDDLIVAGFLRNLLECLQTAAPEVLILNSRSFQGAEIVERRRVPLGDARVYGPTENDAFLEDLGGYLTYLGGIVIRRNLWIQYFRRELVGTYFAHIDAVCRAKIDRYAHYLPEPGIDMRLHFHTWTARHFEIWNVHFPSVIWGLDGYSDAAKQSVIPRQPLNYLRRILASRAYGRFDFSIWRAVLMRSNEAGFRVKVGSLVVALLPREWFRLLYLLFIGIGRSTHSRGFSPDLARALLGRTVK